VRAPLSVLRVPLREQVTPILIGGTSCCVLWGCVGAAGDVGEYVVIRDFDRVEHVYQGDGFSELIKDAIRFFNGTPVHSLSLLSAFNGIGVYSLYYVGSFKLYAKYAEINRLSYDKPIYVGKAVRGGWRQGRGSNFVDKKSAELRTRLRQHERSICAVTDETLDVSKFLCRFVIFEGDSADMIGAVEAALIRYYKPLWNSLLDGFGNHDPGKGRYNQAKSDWDVLHPGRAWADKCVGVAKTREEVVARVSTFMEDQ
jgi:hypothetical protein